MSLFRHTLFQDPNLPLELLSANSCFLKARNLNSNGYQTFQNAGNIFLLDTDLSSKGLCLQYIRNFINTLIIENRKN